MNEGAAPRVARAVLLSLVAIAGVALLAYAIHGWALTGRCASSNFYETKVKPCPERFVSDAVAFFAGLVLLPLGAGVALPGGRAICEIP